LFDLDLETAMSQSKGRWMIEENLHADNFMTGLAKRAL
jgi:hypothetical protein